MLAPGETLRGSLDTYRITLALVDLALVVVALASVARVPDGSRLAAIVIVAALAWAAIGARRLLESPADDPSAVVPSLVGDRG